MNSTNELKRPTPEARKDFDQHLYDLNLLIENYANINETLSNLLNRLIGYDNDDDVRDVCSSIETEARRGEDFSNVLQLKIEQLRAQCARLQYHTSRLDARI